MSESPFITNVTSATFSEQVLEKSNELPVMVDFWAGWCNPCKMLMPILAKLADEYQGKFLLAKVDTDQERELAAQYGIRSLPTIQLFKYGQAVDEFMGVVPESDIREIIERHIAHKEDEIYQQALAALETGDETRALELLQQAYALNNSHKAIGLTLARLYLKQGHFDEIEPILKQLGPSAMDDQEVLELKAQLNFIAAVEQAADKQVLINQREQGPLDSQSLYQLGAYFTLDGDFENALETFLALLKQDRSYGDDAARKAMLQVFDMLGGSGPLVSVYRSKIAQALH